MLSFTDEREPPRRAFLRSVDPDLLIGYNIVNFDFPYLINRAATLGVEDFPYWGRMIGSKLRMKDTTFSSKAYGTRDSKEITTRAACSSTFPGGAEGPQAQLVLPQRRLRALPGRAEEDVHHSAISELQVGTRRPDASPCTAQGRVLPQRLLDKLMYMYNYIEMARVTGVPPVPVIARPVHQGDVADPAQGGAARAARAAHAQEGRRRPGGGRRPRSRAPPPSTPRRGITSPSRRWTSRRCTRPS